jgi:hypothetical protein
MDWIFLIERVKDDLIDMANGGLEPSPETLLDMATSLEAVLEEVGG